MINYTTSAYCTTTHNLHLPVNNHNYLAKKQIKIKVKFLREVVSNGVLKRLARADAAASAFASASKSL